METIHFFFNLVNEKRNHPGGDLVIGTNWEVFWLPFLEPENFILSSPPSPHTFLFFFQCHCLNGLNVGLRAYPLALIGQVKL